ncbi:hypothetical protein SRHO_G00341930 [Serrasalmus rhombeus]
MRRTLQPTQVAQSTRFQPHWATVRKYLHFIHFPAFRKEQKEAVRNELDEEINDKKETEKKRGRWQRIRLAFRVASPGSNSDVPPSQLKATSEITPGSADDMCLSSRPLERPVVVQVHSDSHLQRQSVFGRLLHVLRREQGLQRSTGEGRGHSLTNVCQLGFPNIGNTCFMNATLQCLLSLTCFWTPIIAQQASWMDTASSQMLRCLAELQQARLSSSKKQKKQLLRALKSCLSARCPAFDGYDQEDAHEFLMLILLQLKEEGEALRTSCVSSICPVEHFEFQLKSVRTCTSCGLQVSRVEDFNHLSLNLRSTLAHSLHAYFQWIYKLPSLTSVQLTARSVHPQASTDCMVLCLIWGTAWTAATTSVM